jgi:hypothetical protein
VELLEEFGTMTYHRMVAEMRRRLFDPPHEMRVRTELLKLEQRDKIGRSLYRHKSSEFHGSEYIYYPAGKKTAALIKLDEDALRIRGPRPLPDDPRL